MSKTYLGDSVYAESDGLAITLTTDNGYGASNTIVLEGEVFAALLRFAAQPVEPMPWCEACQSYHAAANPSCRAKAPPDGV